MTELPDIYGDNSAQTHNYARFPVEFTRGEGAYLYDRAGSRYLDLIRNTVALGALTAAASVWVLTVSEHVPFVP